MKLTNEKLHETLQTLTKQERKITAEIIEHIAEADKRKLFLTYGHSSLFQYLIDLGYSNAAAQRRIEAARLHNEIGIAEEIKTGALNLSQISVVASGLRNSSPKTKQEKKQIVNRIKNCDTRSTQIQVAQMLDLPVISDEKKRLQQDESVRVEMTFTKAEWAEIQQARELLSHKAPQATTAQIIVLCAREVTNKRDPAKFTSDRKSESTVGKGVGSKAVPAPIRRAVFQKYNSCQWRDPSTGRQCRSRHQLQIDHIQPKWAGGTHDLNNLQVLCSQHNRWKYQGEGGAWWARSVR